MVFIARLFNIDHKLTADLTVVCTFFKLARPVLIVFCTCVTMAVRVLHVLIIVNPLTTMQVLTVLVSTLVENKSSFETRYVWCFMSHCCS